MNCVQLPPSIRCGEVSLPCLILLESDEMGAQNIPEKKIEAITIARCVDRTRAGNDDGVLG